MRNHESDQTQPTIAMKMFAHLPLRLSVVSGQDKGKSYFLDKKPIDIGCSSVADFVLSDPLVSEKHARLESDGMWWILHDLNSENGCFLNDKLVKSTPIFPGELLRLGNTKLGLDYVEDSNSLNSKDGPPPEAMILRNGEWVHLPRIIAHELRNYIEFLDVGVEHLQKDPDVEKRFGSEIQTLKIASEKIDELSHSLRDGCLPPVFKRVNLSELVYEQLALLEPKLLDRKIQLSTLINDKPHYIYADSNQIGRCILNLFKNAMEACCENDKLTVELKTNNRISTRIIQESGCGMSKKTLETMWVPFFTTKSNGNGLGAFIARTVILRHKGKIWADSVEGSGTIIRIEFPLLNE
jgi:pSer/pThr/pTyr-binding forkhead associated (FHA) protein